MQLRKLSLLPTTYSKEETPKKEKKTYVCLRFFFFISFVTLDHCDWQCRKSEIPLDSSLLFHDK